MRLVAGFEDSATPFHAWSVSPSLQGPFPRFEFRAGRHNKAISVVFEDEFGSRLYSDKYTPDCIRDIVVELLPFRYYGHKHRFMDEFNEAMKMMEEKWVNSLQQS